MPLTKSTAPDRGRLLTSDLECRAQCWWLWLSSIGITEEQLAELSEDIHKHGLSVAQFYERLETRGAPAVLTFLNQFCSGISDAGAAKPLSEPSLFDIG